MSRIRTLVIDEDTALLDPLTKCLANMPRIEIVGFAWSGVEGCEAAARLRPDLVVLNLALSGLSGLGATQRLKKQPRPPRVIVVSGEDKPFYGEACALAGADAYLPVDRWPADFAPTILGLFA